VKREYSKHGDVLTFKFHVPGWSQDQINALAHEIVAQAEASDDHPDAPVIESSTDQLESYLKRRFAQLNCLVLQGADRRGTYADEAEEIAGFLNALAR
jgi:hypothetical protein